jgi:hypothetical protein
MKIPDFNSYACKNLKEQVDKIIQKWKSIDYDFIPDFKLKQLIDLVMGGISINEKEIIILLRYVKDTEIYISENYGEIGIGGYISNLYQIARKRAFNSNTEKILGFLYEASMFYYADATVFGYLRAIGIHIIISNQEFSCADKLVVLYMEFLKCNKSFISFLAQKIWENNVLKDSVYLEKNVVQEFGIPGKSHLMRDIHCCILSLYWLEAVERENTELSQRMLTIRKKYATNPQRRDNLYAKILDYYQTKNISEYSDTWFDDIKNELGTVKINNKIQLKWLQFSDTQRETFTRWVNYIKLDEFFTKSVNEPDRKFFWQRYLSYIIDLEYYEKIGQAIVLELRNHTVIEFCEMGNAAFVYRKEDFSLQEAENIDRMTYKNAGQKKYSFKHAKHPVPIDREASTPGWKHSTNWQYRFESRLYELGYASNR